ncbi:cupin domain-containing protein [Gilvibacter sediminis]|uniref:cupin domain-containing protein n=1 Tax=Gilvibacter sediminis TaxID=379071 RepID=UPI00234FCC79|nr:cupin domain-containing protein [Gilvibacter sediminis]MDC7997703.1 cupin domain-containing protein [Gilvibacter sediminis]
MNKKPKIASIDSMSETLMSGARNVIFNSEHTDGDIYLVQGIMPEGSEVPVHIHELEDEIFHVLEGTVELILGNETIEGNVGDIIYLPRGIKHGIKTKGTETAKVLNYVIPGKNFENFFNEMSEKKIGVESDEGNRIAKKYGIKFL